MIVVFEGGNSVIVAGVVEAFRWTLYVLNLVFLGGFIIFGYDV